MTSVTLNLYQGNPEHTMLHLAHNDRGEAFLIRTESCLPDEQVEKMMKQAHMIINGNGPLNYRARKLKKKVMGEST
jgi:hypothetical protein